MTACTLQIFGKVSGLPSGEGVIALTLSPATPVGQFDTVNLASGANTITLPVAPNAPSMLIIIPPAGNSTAITVKGISGDTGIPLSPTLPAILTFKASPPATIIITTGGIINGVQLVWL